MTDYKEIFETALSEACKKTAFSDNDQLFSIVKERTSKMEKKRTKSKKPAFIAASIAAAAALAVSAGALVNYYHQQSVDAFINDTSGSRETPFIDEESMLTSANEHFRITLDKTYYDGANLTCILTVESLDGSEIPNLGVTGTHNEDFKPGSTYPLNCWVSANYKWDDTDYTQKRAYEAHITEDWLRKLYTPEVGDDGLTGGTYFKFKDCNYIPPDNYVLSDDGTYVPEVPESEWNVFFGITLYTDVEKNVKTADLFSETGDKIILSEIGYYSNEVNAYPMFDDDNSDLTEQGILFILNDGTTKALDSFFTDAEWNSSGCYVLFSDTIQLEEYIGIEVNGVRYLKNN